MLFKATEKHSYRFKAVILCLLISFSLMSAVPSQALAQGVFRLPAPGTVVPLSTGFTPVMLRGLQVYPDNPFKFDFIVDSGNSGLQGEALKEESQKIAKYFLATLTTPEQDLWVNLSPYENERIIPKALGEMDMGQDLLSQDYILKQITASLILPDSETGKVFWGKVYKKAYEEYGTTNIPTDTFNKVWIVPQNATVYEDSNKAFITEGHLKVMLEEDYQALQESQLVDSREHVVSRETFLQNTNDQILTTKNSLTSSVAREVLIPLLEQEVNEGKNFAQLRQMFYAMVLATWYKKALKTSILNKVYADKNKVSGINANDPQAIDKIYHQYLTAYKKGVCDIVKVEQDPYAHKSIARKYFSGGFGSPGGMPISSAINKKPLSSLTSGLSKFIIGTAFAVALMLGSPDFAAARSTGDNAKPLIEQTVMQESNSEGDHNQQGDEESDPVLTAEEQQQEFVSDPYSYIRKNLSKDLEAEVMEYEKDVREARWYKPASPVRLHRFIQQKYSSYDYYHEPSNAMMKIYIIPVKGLYKNTGRKTFAGKEFLSGMAEGDIGWNVTQKIVVAVDEEFSADKSFLQNSALRHKYSYGERTGQRVMLSLLLVCFGALAGLGGWGSYSFGKNRMIKKLYKVLSEGNEESKVSLSGDSLVLKVGRVKVIITRDTVRFGNLFRLSLRQSDYGGKYFIAIMWLLPFLLDKENPDLPQIKDFIWGCLKDFSRSAEAGYSNNSLDGNYQMTMTPDGVTVLDFLLDRMIQDPAAGSEMGEAIRKMNLLNHIDPSKITESFIQKLILLSRSIAQNISSGKASGAETLLKDLVNKLDDSSAQAVLRPFFEEMKEVLKEYSFAYENARLKLARAAVSLLLSNRDIDLPLDDKKVLLSAALVGKFISFWRQDFTESEEIAQESSTRLTARIADSLMNVLRLFPGGWAQVYWPTIFSFIKETKDVLGESSCDLLEIILKGREISGKDLEKFDKQVIKFIDRVHQNPEIFKSRKLKTLAILFESTNQELVDYILKTSNAKLIEAFDDFTELLFSDNFSSEAREYIFDYFLKNVSRDKQLSFLREMKAWCKTSIMQENSPGEWKIFLEHYYQDFGPLVSTDLFKVYKHLIEGKALDAPEVQAYALDKTLNQTGAEGIQQLKSQIDNLRKAIFKQETLTEEVLTSPLLTALAIWILRFSAGSWSHGVARNITLAQFLSEYQQAQATAPALDENVSRHKTEIVSIHKMGSIDFTTDEKEMFARYGKLFEQALNLVEGKKEEKIFSLMQDQWTEYLRAKEGVLMIDAAEQQNPKAKENIEKNVRLLQDLLRNIKTKGKMIDIEEMMIFNGNNFLLKDNDFSTLFNLSLIVDAFIQYPAQQEKVKEILENGLDVSALSGILTFKENLLKDHVLKDSEKAGHILNIFKTKIFKEALERREKLEDTLDLKFRPITKGLFLALAGSFGNACYTRISVANTLNHPTMVGAIPFSGDMGAGEQILGSVVILENNTKEGKIWMLRAINPIEQVADSYNMEEFMRELIKVVRKRAPEDVQGIYLTLEPGTTSNRPQINSLAKKFSSPKAEKINREESFNGYKIEQVYKSILSESSEQVTSASSTISLGSQESKLAKIKSLEEVVAGQKPLFVVEIDEESAQEYKIPTNKKEVAFLMKRMLIGGRSVAKDIQQSLKAQDMMAHVDGVLKVRPSDKSAEILRDLSVLVGEKGSEEKFMQAVEELAKINPFTMFYVNTARIPSAEQAFKDAEERGVQNITRADLSSEITKNLLQHGGFGVVISDLAVEGSPYSTLSLSINRQPLLEVDPLWNLARWRSANEHSDYNQHNYLMNQVEGGTPIFIASEDRFFAANGDFHLEEESFVVKAFREKVIERPRLDFPESGKNISQRQVKRVEKYTTSYRAREKIVNGTFMMMVIPDGKKHIVDLIGKADSGDYAVAKDLFNYAFGFINDLRARQLMTGEAFYDKAISDAQQGHEGALEFLVFTDKIYYWASNRREEIPRSILEKVRTFLKTMDVAPYRDRIKERNIAWNLDHLSELGNEAVKKVLGAQSSSAVGGINFDAKNLDLKRTGEKVQFDIPAEWQGVDLENILGFTPIILHITPMISVNAFWGMETESSAEELPSLSRL